MWAVTIEQRILHKTIRKYMLVAAFLFIALFVLRMIRYALPDVMSSLSRNMIYWYYVLIILPPLFLFFGALSIGKASEEKLSRGCVVLGVLAAALCIAVLTNDWHHQTIWFRGSTDEIAGHDQLYAGIVIWLVLLVLFALIVMVHRCRLSQSRKLWWIPPVSAVFPSLMLIVYLISGGSPVLFGKKLYCFQEAYCLLFIFFWESCIQIGLIPANSDYEEIFRLSSTRAFLLDRAGKMVYQSSDEISLSEEQMREVQMGELLLPGFQRVKSHMISGGTVYWIDDFVKIEEMNESLLKAVDLISEENTLLREEQKLREMHTRVETQNRLYDQIAFGVHRQLSELSGLLLEKLENEPDFRKKLTLISILGAYIKRCANLMLLAESDQYMELDELRLSIEESMEYLRLAEYDCAVNVETDGKLSSETVLLAYDFFEEVLERAFPVFTFFYVSMRVGEEFVMTCLLDEAEGLEDWNRISEKWINFSGKLTILREEDAVYARLIMGAGSARHGGLE